MDRDHSDPSTKNKQNKNFDACAQGINFEIGYSHIRSPLFKQVGKNVKVGL